MPDKPARRFARRAFSRLDARITALVRRFQAGEKQIENTILRGILSGDLWKMRERRRLNREAQEELRSLYRERDLAVDQLIADHFDLGRRIAEAGLERAIQSSEVQREALRILTENLNQNLGEALDTVGRRVDDVFRKEGLRSAREHAAGGEEVKVARTLRERLVRQGVTSFTDSSGRRWSLVDYTRMSVRTVTAEAVNKATEIVLIERGFDVVEVNSVTKPCKVCLPYNGEVVSLSGKTKGVMPLKELPPFHPECRHFIFPTSRTVEEREKTLEVITP